MPTDETFYRRAALHVELQLCLDAARHGIDVRAWAARVVRELREVR